METNHSEYIKIMSLKPNILLVNLTKFHSEISFDIWTSSNTYFEREYFWKRVFILSWLWSIIHQNSIKDLFWNGCRYVESRISLIEILCKKTLSLIPASVWLSRPMKYSYEWCIVYYISRDNFITYVMWLLLFSVVFKAVRIIWRH